MSKACRGFFASSILQLNRRHAPWVALPENVADADRVLGLTPQLLAPGDGKAAALDPAGFAWTRIRDASDPAFRGAYDALWGEFGAANEMEEVGVLAERFALGTAMRYEMVVAHQDGELAAARDHTAIWMEGEVVVHLSHVLVREPWRRTGLGGWMRAVPILAARAVAADQGDPSAPITLIGEMEFDDGSDAKRAIRLLAYQRAGYVKVDPHVTEYHQPDFRSAAEIDAGGGPMPLPFQLVVRQVGRESDRVVSGERVRRWVRALYAMYGAHFRPQDMAHPALQLDRYPAPDAAIALLPPTQP